MSKGGKVTLLIIAVLLADQILKIWVKTTMVIGQTIPLAGDWANIHFIENNGMAFGMEFGGDTGKVVLTLFRIVASVAILYYLIKLIKKDVNTGLIMVIGAIFAGATGNIIDSTFYGVIFSESWYQTAVMFPEGGGYSGLLKGRVVDMFYFPVINTTWPEWFPFKGGDRLIFFRPVFNIADAAITTGVITLIAFQKKYFKDNNLSW